MSCSSRIYTKQTDIGIYDGSYDLLGLDDRVYARCCPDPGHGFNGVVTGDDEENGAERSGDRFFRCLTDDFSANTFNDA